MVLAYRSLILAIGLISAHNQHILGSGLGFTACAPSVGLHPKGFSLVLAPEDSQVLILNPHMQTGFNVQPPFDL